MIQAILVDDEELNLRNLEILIKENCKEIAVAGCFQSAAEAIEFIDKNAIDIVFLDISMPHYDGFDLLESFPERNFQVIFVTAYEEYAIKAIKAGATDYILKPIMLDELKSAVNKVLKIHKEKYQFNPKGKIVLSYSGGRAIFDPEEILYVQGIDNMSKIFLNNERRIMVSKTLKFFEDTLDERFFRVHKSYLVNLDYATEIISEEVQFVKLKDSIKLPISRRNYKLLNEKINVG